MRLENDKIKSLLKKIKYSGSYDNIYDVVDWLREVYQLYIWVERDTYWKGYRFVYEFDKPRGKSTGPVDYNYYSAMENGIEDAVKRLLYYIEKPSFESYGYKKIFDEI